MPISASATCPCNLCISLSAYLTDITVPAHLERRELAPGSCLGLLQLCNALRLGSLLQHQSTNLDQVQLGMPLQAELAERRSRQLSLLGPQIHQVQTSV